MFDYSSMTPQKFEELAKVYLETEYPDHLWNITERSGDGNRDVFCRYAFADAEIEYWAEAKFTSSSKAESLKKGQLDPTLISAFLYTKPIAKIQFISNNTMPENYYYRLEDFRIKTSIGVRVVEKEEFEQWLAQHKEVCAQFQIFPVFPEILAPHAANRKSIEIKSALITLQDQNRPYAFEKFLVTHTKYALYLLIKNNDICPRKVGITLQPTDLTLFSRNGETNYDRIELGCGISAIKIFLTSTEEFSGNIVINLHDPEDFSDILACFIIKNIKCLHPKIMQVVYTQQSRILAETIQSVQYNMLHNEIFYISGSGATGKSHIFRLLQDELNDFYQTHYFSFTGNFISDGELFCRMLLYMNMGDILDQDLNSLLEIVRAQDLLSVQKLFLETLIMKFQDGVGVAINHLTSTVAHSAQFVFPSQHMIKSIIILDDIHKLPEEIKKLLEKCLLDFSWCSNNQILICGSREMASDWFDMLDLDAEYTHQEQLLGLSATDKLDTIQYYFPGIDRIEFDNSTNDLLSFTSVTTNLLAKLADDSTDTLSKRAAIEKCYRTGQTSNKSILKSKLKKYGQYNELLEIVYYIRSGIEYHYLAEKFPQENINFLLEEKLFLFRDEKIYPFHDLYVEIFFEIRKPTEKIGSHILELAAKYPEQDFQYYSLLLSLSPAHYWHSCAMARVVRDKYFRKTSLYPAYVLAKAVVDNRPALHLEDKEYARDLFVLASSSFYEKTSKEIISLYQKAIDCGQRYQGDPAMDAMILHAKTEIVNQKFWAFDIKGLNNEIESIQKSISLSDALILHDEKYALLNCFNRKMVIALLLDQYSDAEQCFDQAIQKAKNLNEPAYEGFAHMDYARGLYLHDPEAALEHMTAAQNIFADLEGVERRKAECDCEMAYLNCLSQNNTENLKKLIQKAAALRDLHYWELYAKAEIKISAIHLLSNSINEHEISQLIVTSEYVLPTVPTKRFQLILSHIKFLFYSLTGNRLEAMNLAQKYYELSRDLGPLYKKIGYRQKVACPTRSVVCAKENTLSHETRLLLDPRIW